MKKQFLLLLTFALIYPSLFAQDTIPIHCGVEYVPQKSMMYKDNSFWSTQIIPYELDDDLEAPTKRLFLEAVDYYNTNTNICLIPKWQERQTLTVSQSTDNVGYGSSDGIVILANSFLIIHEIGHALGLMHEHQRPDRDDFISVVYQNVEPNFIHAFDKLPSFLYNISSTYDYKSVMHYRSTTFSTNGSPTILAPFGVTLGSDELSILDIHSINQTYPKIIDCDSARVNRAPAAIMSYNITGAPCNDIPVTFETTAGATNDVLWVFEGATPSTSTDHNPTVIYKKSGRYKVTLKVMNSFGEDVSTETIRIAKCNNVEQIFPNPTDGLVYINFGNWRPNDVTLQLHSITGQLIQEQLLYDYDYFNYLVHLQIPSSVANGVYILKITSGETLKTYKLVLKR